MWQRALSASVITVLLLFVPLGLTAQEREARGPAQVSVVAWLAGLWSEVAAWLASDWEVDGTCAVDPNGCPEVMGPAPSAPESDQDGRAAVDPNG